MQRRKILLASATIIATLTLPIVSATAATHTLELFGTPLKGAQRDHLRQVLKQGGMTATRENQNYWVDLYNSNGVLQGASKFEAGYVSKTNQFAYAQYTFAGFMDTGLVKKVIDLVTSKYGKPASRKGQYNLGTVTATWTVGQNMKIEVSRGWPDTTTYLSFVDIGAHQAMQAEIDAMKKERQKTEARAQSNAF